MTPFMKGYRIVLAVFSVLVLGSIGYSAVTYTPLPPEFYPLGVSAGTIEAVYTDRGFTLAGAEPYEAQPQRAGLSSDGAAYVQLIGPPADLVGVNVSVYMTLGLPEQVQDERREHLDLMIDTVLPEWTGGHDWLADEALSMKGAGRRSTDADGVKVTMVVRELDDGLTLSLLFGDQSRAPTYEEGVGWSD